MRDVTRLIDACCEAYDNPAWIPHDGKTFCNFAVNYICHVMGYDGFGAKSGPLLANAMIDLMRANLKIWQPIPMAQAQQFANQGSLVIACQSKRPHGHVAVIRPGEQVYSTKWKAAVPKCVNIGAQNSIGRGINWVFPARPEIFVWFASV